MVDLPDPLPAADQDYQAALGHHDVFQYRRQAHMVDVRNLGGDSAHDHADMLLHEYIHAKTPDAVRANRKVALMRRFELGGLAVGHNGAHQLLGMHRGQHLWLETGPSFHPP